MKTQLLLIVIFILGYFLYKKVKKKRASIALESPNIIEEKIITIEPIIEKNANIDLLKLQKINAYKILLSGLVAAMSLFLPWRLSSDYGISSTPMLFGVLLWWYSLNAAFYKKNISKFFGVLLGFLSLLLGVFAAIISVHGNNIGYGAIVYLAATCFHILAVWEYTEIQRIINTR